MIDNARDLNAWMRAQMPALDEDRYHCWNTGTPRPGSLVVLIHVRLQTPFTADRTTTVILVARPITTDSGAHRASGNASSRPQSPPPNPTDSTSS